MTPKTASRGKARGEAREERRAFSDEANVDIISLRGTVVGEPGRVVLADVTLTVGERPHRARRQDIESLSLRLEEGRTVEVLGVPQAAREGLVELEGTYGELASHPVARLFDARAPGDHVRARIHGFAVVVGDTVTVEAESVEERFVQDSSVSEGTLRSAPRREPAVVRARRIVLDSTVPRAKEECDGARSERTRGLEERVRRPLATSAGVAFALGLAFVVGGLVASWTLPIVSERAWLTPLVGVGLSLMLVGLHRFHRGRAHASFVSTVGGQQRDRNALLTGYRADPWIVFGSAFVATFAGVAVSPTVASVVLALPAAIALWHAGIVAYEEAPFRRFARLVLGLEAHGEPEVGRMRLFEGRVVSERGALRRTVEFVREPRHRYRQNDSGGTGMHTYYVLAPRETLVAASFDIESGERTVRVVPQGALFAASRRRWIASASPAAYEETVSQGDVVCVGGRPRREDRGLSLAAGGEESLFVFGGSRRDLVRALWVARARPVLVALLAVCPVAMGLHAAPFAARFRVSGTVTESSNAVPVGARCDVRWLAYHDGFAPRCSLRLSCDGRALYGGLGAGSMACAFAPSPFEPTIEAEDASAEDGDPAVRVSLDARTLEWRDEAGARLRIALADDAHPSLAW